MKPTDKVYTAQEMLACANKEEHSYHDRETAAMLRQGARLMEGMKIEYCVKYFYKTGRCKGESTKVFANRDDAEGHGRNYVKDGETFKVFMRFVSDWKED